MTHTVPLDNVIHKDLRVVTRHGAEFADNINQVLLFPTEFGDAHREYPIFFRRDAEGHFQSVALLGLDRDENLFLDEAGWQARYIPAVQARGPFLIGMQEHEIDGETRREAMIHVDMEHPRIVPDGEEGEPVFLPHGGNSPYLEHISHILRLIHDGVEIAQPMFGAFEAAGILEPVAVEAALSDEEHYKIPGLFTVSEERLARLDGAALEQLNTGGFLGAAFLVAASMGNVNRLIELKKRKRQAG
jgi:hypothetical protein